MLSDKDLDELDALLLSIPEEAGGMLLPELDGFSPDWWSARR